MTTEEMNQITNNSLENLSGEESLNDKQQLYQMD